jgi:hypothetical protein
MFISISATIRILQLAACLLVSVAICGCQSTPNSGGLVRLEVTGVPHQRSDIHENQQVDESLEVFSQEIHEGRLVKVRCGSLDSREYAGVKFWSGLLLLQKAGSIKQEEIAQLGRLLLEGKQGKVFASDRANVGAANVQFAQYQYPGSKAQFKVVECQWNSSGNPINVQVLDRVPSFELDFSRAERLRHRMFSDEDLMAGRIAIGQCSLRLFTGEVYHQPVWIVRIPEGTSVRKNDVIEVKLGDEEGGGEASHLSEMTRVLGKRENFPRVGNTAILCN